MYAPSFNPYSPYGPTHPGSPASAPGPPYPVYSAADSSQSYGSTRYGPPAPSSSGYGGGGGTSGHGGSSYGPPAPPSGGGYEYHPPAPPHPPPHPVPHHHHHFPIHVSSPKSSKKGKGAALSALTLLAFLYFLNLLQSCLKEHMDTMNPTVMVMTAGATRRKDVDDVLVNSKDEMLGEYDAPMDDGFETHDGKFHLLTTSGNGNRTQLDHGSFFGGAGNGGDNGERFSSTKIRRPNGGHRQHYREEDEGVVYDDYD